MKYTRLMAVLTLAIMVGTTGGMWADDASPSSNDPEHVGRAMEALRQSVGWKHLDRNRLLSHIAGSAAADTDARDPDMKVDAPEMNVDVSVVTADGNPIADALVAIQESITEASERVALLPDPYRSIRGLAATDQDGRCLFSGIRVTPAGLGRKGRIRAFIVVAHPIHGFDFYTLQRTSRTQRVTIPMRPQVATPVRVAAATRIGGGSSVRLRMLHDRSTPWHTGSGLDADDEFSPRITLDENGSGVFPRLPRDMFVGFALEQQQGWGAIVGRTLWETEKPVSIDASHVDSSLPIRFVDAATRRGVAGVSVDRWRRAGQPSDEDGMLMVRPAFPDRVMRMGRQLKYQFTVEPPADWVREQVLEFPHQIGSPPVSFQLVPSTAVRGRVVDAKTGQGIVGVIVQSQRPFTRPGGISSQLHAVGVSDESGAFTLSAPAGRQTVSVAAHVDGYLLPREQRLAVIAGRPGKPIEIKLMPAEAIRGKIVDKDGRPVENAEVVCHDGKRNSLFRGGYPLESTIVSARTDVDGEFALVRPPGSYESLLIKAIADGGRQTRDAFIEYDCTSNRPLDVDLTLSPGDAAKPFELVGMVTKEGEPWHGAIVLVDPPYSQVKDAGTVRIKGNQRGWGQLGEAKTDQQGRFRINIEVADVDRVRVGVLASAEQRWSLAAAQMVALSGPRVDIPPIRVREKVGRMSLSGIVVDPFGNPASDMVVRATNQSAARVDRARTKGDPHRVTTGPTGRFTLRSLLDGPVELRVSPAGIPLPHAVAAELTLDAGTTDARIVCDRSLSRVPELIEPVTKLPLTESAPRIRYVDPTRPMEPGPHVRGTVADQNGRGVDRAIVRVFTVQSGDSLGRINPLCHPSCRMATQTDSQGRFTIGPFPTGARIRVAAGASGLSAALSEMIRVDQDGAIVDLTLTKFDPQLPAMKTTHQLIDHTGRPLAGAIIATNYTAYRDVIEFSSNSDPCVMTDREGKFRFPTAGVDYVTVAAFPIDRPATVIRNRYSHRTYRLSDPTSIRGRIVDRDGAPLSQCRLLVRVDRFPGLIQLLTDHDGQFRVDGLPCGEECTISGVQTSGAKHYLETRRFESVARHELDFGDLVTISGSPVRVKVTAPSKSGLPSGLSLRLGRTTIPVSRDGVVVFSASPPTSFISLDGPAKVIRTVPPLQKHWKANTYGINTSAVKELEMQIEPVPVGAP